MKKKTLLILLTLTALTLLCAALAEEFPVDPYRDEVMAHHLQSDRIFSKAASFVMELSVSDDLTHPVWTVTPRGNTGTCTYYFQMSHEDAAMSNGLDLVATSHGYIESNTFTAQIVASGNYQIRVWGKDEAGATSYLKQPFEVSDPALPTLESRIAEIGEECKAAGCETDFEIALWIHDWLTSNAFYDDSYTNYGTDGVLLRGTGVCDSYAGAYMHLLKYLGLECNHVAGRVSSGSHAWNAAKLDGQWYWIDATWDDPAVQQVAVSGYEQHYYFGLPSEVFYVDHTPSQTPSYTCDHYEDNYFIHTGKVRVWTDLFSDDITAALGRGLYRSVLTVPSSYPSEKAGHFTSAYKHIVFNVTAYALSCQNWEAFGEELRLDAAFNAERRQMTTTLRFDGREVNLPPALAEISEEAFSGDSLLMSVTLGDSVTTIGANAFRGCAGLWRIYVPASVTSIDPTAFIGCPHVTIIAPVESYAETFALENNLTFEAA